MKAGEVLRRLALLAATEQMALRNSLPQVCRELAAAQPFMAAVLNLCNEALWAAQGQGRGGERARQVEEAVETFLARMKQNSLQVTTQAAKLIRGSMVVMTHSYSSAVRNAILRAWAAGRRFRVVLTEARPLREGLMLARELAAEGIPVTLGVDSAAGLLVEKADLVLVGADAVSSHVLVNKAGTWLAAMAARERGKKFLALAGAEKAAPEGWQPVQEGSKDPREVLRSIPRKMQVQNLYFDFTSLDLLTGIVSEHGVVDPEEFRNRAHPRKLHPALSGRRSELGS